MITTKPQVEPGAYYSQAQAARALGVDRHTVARYVRDGRIRCRVRGIDRRAVIPGSEILKAWGRMLI